MTRLGWLEPLENVYYDYWHQFAGKRRDALHTAVVAVDTQKIGWVRADDFGGKVTVVTRDAGQAAERDGISN
jgi:CHASE2 domain-containing sensor protein